MALARGLLSIFKLYPHLGRGSEQVGGKGILQGLVYSTVVPAYLTPALQRIAALVGPPTVTYEWQV